MKKTILIILLLVLSQNFLYSQSASDKIPILIAEKKYEEAAALIPQAAKEKFNNIEFLLLCGDIYMELDRLDSALILYRKADNLDRNETPILRKIGRTLSMLGRHSEAIEILKDAIKREKEDVYNYLELGQAYIRADSMAQATLTINKAKGMNKSLPDPYIALGDMYFKQGIFELARDNFEQALSIDEKIIDARIKLATSYYWMANREMDRDLGNEYFARSLKEWNTVTKQDPKYARAYFEQGKILFLSKKWNDAAVSLYEYINLRPSGSLGRWYLAQSLYELGSCDSASTQLRRCANEIDSVKSKALLLLARCYFDSQKYKEATEIFGEVKTITELDATDLERYGAAAFINGDTALSVQNYKESIEKDSTKCKLIYKLGRILMFLTKDYNEAVKAFKLYNENCADSLAPTIQYYIGLCYFFGNKPDSAYIEFNKSIAMDSSNLKAYFYLGDVYAALGNIDSAKFLFNYVIDKGMQDTANYKWELNQAFFKLSGVYLKEKKYTELKNTATKWTEVSPEFSYAFFYLAVAYQGLTDIENACKNYRKVLKLEPQNKSAAEYLKLLKCQ